jgi:hypothetical protein
VSISPPVICSLGATSASHCLPLRLSQWPDQLVAVPFFPARRQSRPLILFTTCMYCMRTGPPKRGPMLVVRQDPHSNSNSGLRNNNGQCRASYYSNCNTALAARQTPSSTRDYQSYHCGLPVLLCRGRSTVTERHASTSGPSTCRSKRQETALTNGPQGDCPDHQPFNVLLLQQSGAPKMMCTLAKTGEAVPFGV